MNDKYVEDYFLEYENYYDEFKDSNMKFKEYNQQITTAVNEYNSFKNFINSANIQGASKKAIEETIELLDSQYKTLMHNIDNSLIPIGEEFMLLKENLLYLKELNEQYKIFLDEYNKLMSNIPDMYITITDENGRKKMILNGDYKIWGSKVTNIEKYLELHIKEIKKIKKLCDDSIKKIKNFESLIKDFSSFEFSMQQNNYLEAGNATSIYWKIDNTVYQLVTPLCKIDGEVKAIELNENYIMIYDLDAIANSLGVLNADGSINENADNYQFYEDVQACLDNAMNGNENYLYKYKKNKYNGNENIGIVLNQVLKSTYEQNRNIPISAVATVFAVNNPIVKFCYSATGKSAYTNGFDEICSYGNFDCIGLLRWSQYQEILNEDHNGNHEIGRKENGFSPIELLLNYSVRGDNFSSLTSEDWENISLGSVLVDSEGGDNYHVARIIGYTTIDGEKAIVVSDARRSTGLTNSAYKISELCDKDTRWDGLVPKDVLDDAAINGTKKGHKNIYEIQAYLNETNYETIGKLN